MLPDASGLWPVAVELFHSGRWNDITCDVDVSDELRITRGRSDYQSSASPARLSFTLDNSDGRYSPRNPVSPLYGLIGRNTPVRVRVGEPEVVARLLGDSTSSSHSNVATPNRPEFNLPGVMDVRFDVEPESWTPDAPQIVVARTVWNTGNFIWEVVVFPSGNVHFRWSPDGDNDNRHNSYIVGDYFGITGRTALRVVVDTLNTTGSHVYDWYRADTLDGPWSYLTTITIEGVSNYPLYAGDAPITIGTAGVGSAGWSGWDVYRGHFYGFQLRDGADGPIVAEADFAGMEPGMTAPDEFTDVAGNVWTYEGSPYSEDLAGAIRFTGHVSAWPPRWSDPDNARTPIEAYGARRLVDRSGTPLRSAMFRASTNPGQAHRTIAYWPMEDGPNATEFASGIGGPAMRVGRIPGYHVRDIDYAAYSDFVASEALPEFHITAAVGTVPLAPQTGELRVYALVHVPEEGVAIDTTVISVATTGSVAEWRVQVTPTGTAQIQVYDPDGDLVFASVDGAFALNGTRALFGLWLLQNGSDIDWQLFQFVETTTVGGVYSGTLLGHDFGSATSVAITPYGDLQGTAVGHVTVMNRDTENLWNGIIDGFHGHAGEDTVDRLQRLGAEEQHPVLIAGTPEGSEPLDVQQVGSLDTLLDEAAESDLGSLHDRRDAAALGYRTRVSLYNQTPVVLDYETDPIVAPFEPIDDDAALENDVTVTRRNGSSFRSVRRDGPLAATPPPEGVGRYDASYTLSLADDAQVSWQAQWRQHLGTVDELRYPTIAVDLHHKPELAATLARVDVGDRLQVTSLPSRWVDAVADVIVQGYTETHDGIRWRLEFNGTPASAWQVGVLDDEVYGRADTAGSELVAAVDATATTLPVLTTDGPRWVEDTEHLPFDVTVGGEHVTVTGVRSLLSDDFGRGDVGRWDDPERGLWDQTMTWGE
ncbi:hypothetical protein B1813_19035 [Saccharomonospora piscinae]|uniref:Uncharacterized protein n=1 Tax=Saccharomonospora piscinae TaxID=687388 RepID=A0A1V8ZYR6_SACPI|nr:hypothetical protein [Saccharomonospora piscinae]OQO89936.1 hypothetical protein B1813_19035 [Saccharomonospora piscinae]